MSKTGYGIKAYGEWKNFRDPIDYELYLWQWARETDGAEQDRAIRALCALYDGKHYFDSDEN
jgi:hypothetical protein